RRGLVSSGAATWSCAYGTPPLTSLVAADLDGDGDHELAATTDYGGCLVFWNDPTPGNPRVHSFECEVVDSWIERGRSIVAGDVDADGRSELVVFGPYDSATGFCARIHVMEWHGGH